MTSVSSTSYSYSTPLVPSSHKRRIPDQKSLKPNKIQAVMDSGFSDNRELWVRPDTIKDLAKRLLNNPDRLKFPGVTAKTFLALVYGFAYYDKFSKIRNCPTKDTLIQIANNVRDNLEIEERIRLFKVLPLMDQDRKGGDFGRRIRQAAYPILYKNIDLISFDGGPSVKNILDEALELIDGLLKNQDWTDDIQILNAFPLQTRLNILHEWRDSVSKRLRLLKEGYEVQLSKYKLTYATVRNPDLSPVLIPTFSSFYSDNTYSLTYFSSQAIEGFAANKRTSETCQNTSDLNFLDLECGTCSSCKHNSGSVELLTDQANLSLFSSLQEPFFAKVTYFSTTNLDSFQQDTLNKLSSRFKEAAAFQQSEAVHQLETAFLQGRQPHFVPKHWELPDSVSKIMPKTILSWDEFAIEKQKQLQAQLLMQQNPLPQASTSTSTDDSSKTVDEHRPLYISGEGWSDTHRSDLLGDFTGSPTWQSFFEGEKNHSSYGYPIL